MPELWRWLTDKRFSMVDLVGAGFISLAIREYIVPHITIAWR